ncbi:helix-turn-helix transcriptional regulator [Salinicola aestuarinus]|uniref:helix-turn-helix transcriptional regulator n=1 Tax=Salinicola aestuarinus TaxID=1949082 RepID=UPI000DA25813|nr:AraC family transcriptional regulator [Salinicola aestuarinus]
MTPSGSMRFWRHPALPFLELRETRAGESVGYARHSHDSFSIGAVTGGRSLFEYQVPGESLQAVPVTRGAVVIMNPREIHACNPTDGTPWSYYMLHVDPAWLSPLQGARGFRPLALHATRDVTLYAALIRLCRLLLDDHATAPSKTLACRDFFRGLFAHSRSDPRECHPESTRLARTAALIRQRCAEPLTLAWLAERSAMTPSHLVRLFKREYGITPHAFLLDCRIRRAREALSAGRPIAEVAHDWHFADQAHFQRIFKRVTATTPNRFRRAS